MQKGGQKYLDMLKIIHILSWCSIINVNSGFHVYWFWFCSFFVAMHIWLDCVASFTLQVMKKASVWCVRWKLTLTRSCVARLTLSNLHLLSKSLKVSNFRWFSFDIFDNFSKHYLMHINDFDTFRNVSFLSFSRR